jgi:MFS family permease
VSDSARRRREYAVGLALCLAGAVILLIAAGRPWTTLVVEVAPELPRSTVVQTGRDLAPLGAAGGAAGLAAVAGVVATRGRLRRAVGVLAAAFGLAAAVAPRGQATVAGRIVAAETSLWPLVGVAGGVLLLAGGVLVAVRGHRWAAMCRRYDAPAGPRGPAGDPGELWEAIDRGDDPTADRA